MVVHHEAVADVEHARFDDVETVFFVGADCLGIAAVDLQPQAPGLLRRAQPAISCSSAAPMP